GHDRLEASIPVCQQDADGAVVGTVVHAPVGHDKVRLTVSVHIGDRHGNDRLGARTIDDGCFLESSIAVTRQHAHRPVATETAVSGTLISHHKVRLPIAIYIGNCD